VSIDNLATPLSQQWYIVHVVPNLLSPAIAIDRHYVNRLWLTMDTDSQIFGAIATAMFYYIVYCPGYKHISPTHENSAISCSSEGQLQVPTPYQQQDSWTFGHTYCGFLQHATVPNCRNVTPHLRKWYHHTRSTYSPTASLPRTST